MGNLITASTQCVLIFNKSNRLTILTLVLNSRLPVKLFNHIQTDALTTTTRGDRTMYCCLHLQFNTIKNPLKHAMYTCDDSSQNRTDINTQRILNGHNERHDNNTVMHQLN